MQKNEQIYRYKIIIECESDIDISLIEDIQNPEIIFKDKEKPRDNKCFYACLKDVSNVKVKREAKGG